MNKNTSGDAAAYIMLNAEMIANINIKTIWAEAVAESVPLFIVAFKSPAAIPIHNMATKSIQTHIINHIGIITDSVANTTTNIVKESTVSLLYI